jgi:hypothetical protein
MSTKMILLNEKGVYYRLRLIDQGQYVGPIVEIGTIQSQKSLTVLYKTSPSYSPGRVGEL